MTQGCARIGIYGGSFNPPHLGHLRLAVEVLEALRPQRLDFLPCSVPPHKNHRSILPFSLRFSMLRAAADGIDRLAVNAMEHMRPGPSYTTDTLRLYRRNEPDARHFFVLGAEDFADVHLWHEWRLLPELADIVVVPRSGLDVDSFEQIVRRHWPEARRQTPPAPAATAAYAMPDGGMFLHLPLTRLDIRSELIRERFAQGLSIRFLVPDCVKDLLEANADAVMAWRNSLQPRRDSSHDAIYRSHLSHTKYCQGQKPGATG